MIKVKYLHRRQRKSEYRSWESKKYKRDNTLDLFLPLPYNQPIRRNFREFRNFSSTPLYEHIYSKIGYNWNDVYSEIIKKIKPKYRRDIDYDIRYHFKDVVYDENFIPRSLDGRMLINTLYIDFNNIICYKTKDDILNDSKRFLRHIKLQEILERIENDENQSSD